MGLAPATCKPAIPQKIRSAAAKPVAAPSTTELPLAYDTTPVTGGFYFWTPAGWVKIAKML